jgi:maltose/maltodextrin transport system permease protein
MIQLPYQKTRVWLARGFLIVLCAFMLAPIIYLVHSSFTVEDQFEPDQPTDRFTFAGWRVLFGKAELTSTVETLYFIPGGNAVQTVGGEGMQYNIHATGRIDIFPSDPWVLEYAPVELRMFAEGLSNNRKEVVRGETLTISSHSTVSADSHETTPNSILHAQLDVPAFSENVDRIRVQYEVLWFYPGMETEIFRVMTNSLKLAFSASLTILVMSTLLAYALVRLKIVMKQQLTALVLVAQMFPSFLLLTTYSTVFFWIGEHVTWLGRSSLYSVFIIYLGSITLSVFLILGYFKRIDVDMEESAFVDGATPWQALRFILIPMSKPVIAVTFMVSFVFFYGEFNIANRMLDFSTMTFAASMFDASYYRLPDFIRDASLLVSCAPVILLFLFIRKHLVSGLADGGTKG